MPCPLMGCAMGTQAASATDGWESSAPSTSAVPILWPLTLMTSSTRPAAQDGHEPQAAEPDLQVSGLLGQVMGRETWKDAVAQVISAVFGGPAGSSSGLTHEPVVAVFVPAGAVTCSVAPPYQQRTSAKSLPQS